jgi:uncharacterized protein YqeY
MLITETLAIDIKDALKTKNAARLTTLRLAKNAIDSAAKEKRVSSLQDSEVIAVLRKEIKKRQDSIESYTKAGRTDLAEKEETEIDILNSYLPQGLTELEIQKIIESAIAESGATSRKQMGAVMKIATAKAAGRVDGKTLSTKVQTLLPA